MKIATWVWLGGAVLMLGAALASRLDAAPLVALPPEPPARVVTREERMAATEAAGWVGVALASSAVDVTSRLDGKVAELRVKVGQRVTAGQVLASLESKHWAHELSGAAAMRDGAADRMRRRSAMLESGVASREEAVAAEADWRAAAARVDELSSKLSDSILRAPFDGVIVSRYLERGAFLAAGKPALRIVGRGPAELRFAVPRDAARRLAPGAAVLGVVEGRCLHATVTSVAVEVDAATGLVRVDAAVTDSFESSSGVTVRVHPADGSNPKECHQ